MITAIEPPLQFRGGSRRRDNELEQLRAEETRVT
jgi:hypothetical protein